LLDGAIEIEVSDGTRRTFRVGEILLREGMQGEGIRRGRWRPERGGGSSSSCSNRTAARGTRPLRRTR
jgi:hypothetical protein